MPAQRTGSTTRRETRFWAVLCMAAACLAQARAQQETTQPGADRASGGVRFRSLELHERREALSDILDRLTAERDRRREEHRSWIDAVAAAQAIPQLSDDEARLRACMEVTAALDRLAEQLRDSRLRRLETLDRIQSEAARPDPLASRESARLLREADGEVRVMLAQQAEQARRMEGLRQQVRSLAAAIPPPSEFQKASGVLWRLVGTGPGAFYSTATPVTVSQFLRFVQAQPESPERAEWEARLAALPAEAALGDLSWYEAQQFAVWLSAQDGAEYRLPLAREAAALAQAHAADPAAFWCADVWVPADHQQRRDLKRFGVTMATLWDPGIGLTGRVGACGEVPFARYPNLMVYLVTARQTGIAHRWARVSNEVP